MNMTEIIEKAIKDKTPPKHGPYSFSRMSKCGLKFKKYAKDREKGLQLSRFGTDVGGAIHEICDRDIKYRMLDKEIKKAEDIVDEYLNENPKDLIYAYDMVYALISFRLNFIANRDVFLGNEDELGVTLDMSPTGYHSPDCWFRGKMDYTELDRGVLRVVDYKNYPRIHSNDELLDIGKKIGAQLMGYSAIAMAHFPQAHSVKFEVYYLRFGTSRSPMIENDKGELVEKIYDRNEVMEWWKFQQKNMMSYELRETWEAEPSTFECQYCPYIKTCDWYIGPGKEEFLAVNDENAKNMLNQLVVLKETEKRIKSALDDFVSNTDNLTTDNGEVYGYEKNIEVKYDIARLIQITKDLRIPIENFLSINKTNFDKICKIVREDEEALELVRSVQIETIKSRKVSPK